MSVNLLFTLLAELVLVSKIVECVGDCVVCRRLWNEFIAPRMLAVALGTNSGTDGMLLQGIFRKASHGFSAGAPLYVGATNGTFTTTAPATGGQYARVVGYVVDSNHIYFSPGTAWVEVG